MSDQPWTREQYDLMQQVAIDKGFYLLTPYRKGLKNIRVGVIKDLCEMCGKGVKPGMRFCDKCSEII